jgi:hypothetical protein
LPHLTCSDKLCDTLDSIYLAHLNSFHWVRHDSSSIGGSYPDTGITVVDG